MISILIPTYNRPGKLLRLLRGLNLYYSKKFSSRSLTSSIPPIEEILIADGSEKQSNHYAHLNDLVTKEINILSSYVNVNYMNLAGYSLNDRLFYLAEHAKSAYVMPLGDDDFPILESLDLALKRIESSNDISVVLGRLINIRGINNDSLCLSIIERPYSGFSIDFDCILSRISSHRVLNALGVPALFYGLQSKTSYLNFTRLLYDNQKDLFYGGQEFLHQLHCCIGGKISFLEEPMVYRDFTYWAYQREAIREAPDTDAYPYYGEKAINMACNMLVNASVFTSEADAINYIDSILNISQSLSKCREYLSHPEIESIVMSLYAKHIPPCSLEAVTRAWLSTLQVCYNLEN